MMNSAKQFEPSCEHTRAALKKALPAVKKFAELEGLGAWEIGGSADKINLPKSWQRNRN